MNKKPREEPRGAPLNPALKSEIETVYQTKVSSRAPFETTSAKENEGAGWPVIWVIVTVVGVVLAIYFLL